MIKLLQAALTVLNFVKNITNKLVRYDTPHKLQGTLPPLVDGAIEYPGHMAFANKGGEYFHGCRVARFRNVQDLNAFFAPGAAGHLKLVAEIIPEGKAGVVVVFTNKLSREDMEDIEEFNRQMHAYFEQKKFERAAIKSQEEEAKRKQDAQDKSDLELGRKYRQRVAKIREMAPGSERRSEEQKLNSGDLLDAK